MPRALPGLRRPRIFRRWQRHRPWPTIAATNVLASRATLGRHGHQHRRRGTRRHDLLRTHQRRNERGRLGGECLVGHGRGVRVLDGVRAGALDRLFFPRQSDRNSGGTAWAAASGTFTTLAASLPAVTTQTATGVSGNLRHAQWPGYQHRQRSAADQVLLRFERRRNQRGRLAVVRVLPGTHSGSLFTAG